MDERLFKYFENGFEIRPIEEGFDIFTEPTQWFRVKSLLELTPERFEKEIETQRQHEEVEIKIFENLGSRI